MCVYTGYKNVCLLVFLLFFVGIASDEDVVKLILDVNKKTTWNSATVATYENGRLTHLNLNNQSIESEGLTQIPAEIGQLTELQVLSIDDNDLTQLPKELFDLKNLRVIQIRDNAITTLPPGIGKLEKLEVLDLRNNQIAELPEELTSLKSLTVLHMWGNLLKTLPSDIGSMSSLKELYLNRNELTALPPSILKLSLQYVDVYDNQLCAVPAALDKWLKKFDDKYKSMQKCIGEKRFK
ncbi:MAG: leucine-rich repeat domain-containing protein [Chitinivibrionales bacterium]|nr:leucine-rich repeat domain-containing protein [Chitinivibrionales bacterium]